MFPSATTIRDTIRDLRELLVCYAKQETIDPLRQLGRYLAFGLGGMALITLGVLLLGFALLRGLQTMTGGLLDGFWSWVPYLVVLLALSGVIAFAMARIGRELDHRGEGDL